MIVDSHRIPRTFLLFGAVLGTALAVALAGCGSKDNPVDPPGSTLFRGAFTGAATAGCLSVVVETDAPAAQVGNRAGAVVAATGSLRLYGSRVDVTGTYDDQADVVVLTGLGWTVNGTLTSSGMEGTFSGPQGPGRFSLFTQGGADTVAVFTGTFYRPSDPDTGNFNFSIRGTEIHGHAIDSSGVDVVLDGTFTKIDGSISIRHPTNPSGPLFATGTWDPDNSVRGTYDDQAGDSGTWVGFKFN